MEFTNDRVPMTRILLDPNNYRFRNLEGWHSVSPTRFHEDGVQQRATQLLRGTKSFELALLKDSIRTNGYVPLEYIVVRPYVQEPPPDPQTYVVVEGNRRIAAMHWLLEDESAGICELPHDTKDFLLNPVVLILTAAADSDDPSIDVLMAIRHVSGVKMWGAYQQARLIVRLMEAAGGASFSSVGQQLGMSTREVGRRYRASMALQQMEQNDEYKAYVTPEMHGLFQETFATTEVREWLGWDEAAREYTHANNLGRFYTLISDIEDQAAQIKSVFDIRVKLKAILKNESAKEALSAQSASLEGAYQQAMTSSPPTGPNDAFENAVRQVSQVVDSLTPAAIRNLPDDQVGLLREFSAKLTEFLDDVARLRDDLP